MFSTDPCEFPLGTSDSSHERNPEMDVAHLAHLWCKWLGMNVWVSECVICDLPWVHSHLSLLLKQCTFKLLQCKFHPSIHPSIHLHPLIRGRVAEVAVPAGSPEPPFSRATSARSDWGIPRLSQASVEIYSPSTWSSVYPVASSQLDVPGTPPEGGEQVASLPDAQTTSTGSSLHKGAAALLRVPPGWPSFSPYPYVRRRPPSWGNPLRPLVSVISFFRSWPHPSWP